MFRLTRVKLCSSDSVLRICFSYICCVVQILDYFFQILQESIDSEVQHITIVCIIVSITMANYIAQKSRPWMKVELLYKPQRQSNRTPV